MLWLRFKSGTGNASIMPEAINVYKGQNDMDAVKRMKPETEIKNILCVGSGDPSDAFAHALSGTDNTRLRRVHTAEEAERFLKNIPFDIIISSYYLDDTNGITFLRRAGLLNPKAVIILNTWGCSSEAVRKARFAGIFTFFDQVPFDKTPNSGCKEEY